MLEQQQVVIIKAKMYIKKLKNLQGKPSSCEAVDGRNSKQELVKASQSAWHSFPFLGKVLPRDLFPFPLVLVEALWDRANSSSLIFYSNHVMFIYVDRS